MIKSWMLAAAGLGFVCAWIGCGSTNADANPVPVPGVDASAGGGGAAGTGGTSTGGSTGEGGGAGSAGMAGTSGNGGTGAGCSSCGSLEQCFNNQFCIAKLVPVTGGYDIDATEVTRDQYAAWLGTSPTTGGQDAWCTWNTSLVPGGQWPPGAEGAHPVVNVDWCDAYAYCKAVGKRLCGKMGGGANAWGDYASATRSQWFGACTSGGKYNFPYGGDPGVDSYDGYDGSKCNGLEQGVDTTKPVATFQDCTSTENGYTGVYDLSGNAGEWEDSCNGISGNQDFCRVRGGNFRSGHGSNGVPTVLLGCASESGQYTHPGRDSCDLYIGFRCCSDP